MQQQALDIFPKPNIDLICGDCLKVMPTLPDKSIDMILCDLPYGTTACKWDTVIPFEPLWKEYKRLIKDRGAIVLFGSEPFSSYLRMSNIEWYKYDWVWDKNGGANFFNLKNRPWKTHEQICVFSNKSDFTFNPQRVSRTPLSLKRDPAGKKREMKQGQRLISHYGHKTISGMYGGFEADGLRHPIDIIKFNVREKGRYKIKHSTKKPVPLCEYLIKTYTNEGDTVLDNCMGSCTTGVACRNLNRDFIGIEKEPEYFEIASKRIGNA